jgi:hypothetical protein
MFRPPKPRQFQYHYRFSDPEKTERDKRVRFIRSEARREREAEEAGEASDAFGPFSGLHQRKRYGAETNRRMIYILMVLLLITVFILLR